MNTSTEVTTQQNNIKTADVVVRGSVREFLQDVVSGKHHLRADEPASAGGSDAAPGPYDYLLIALGVCTSMTVGLYARRKQWPLENITVSLWHSRIHAKDCEECRSEVYASFCRTSSAGSTIYAPTSQRAQAEAMPPRGRTTICSSRWASAHR